MNTHSWLCGATDLYLVILLNSKINKYVVMIGMINTMVYLTKSPPLLRLPLPANGGNKTVNSKKL